MFDAIAKFEDDSFGSFPTDARQLDEPRGIGIADTPRKRAHVHPGQQRQREFRPTR
jgi:hypothetical protein